MSAAAMSVPASSPPRVDPEAARELLALAARELRRAVEELGDTALPLSLLLLTGRLEHAGRRGVGAFTVELTRDSVWAGRRCDLADAFRRLNPGFGPVHTGAWPASVDGGYDAKRQQRAQRRELELCMGARFARMLAPAEGGGAA